MGLTTSSTGANAIDNGIGLTQASAEDQIVVIAGNPNVGKSTVFNQLTGMNQHTGNWPGKTVANATGECEYRGKNYILVDVPGTYSLMAHSIEEEVARDFICFGGASAVVVVCDASCLERNLNLVLQTIEITSKVVVCVNLMDEAKKKQIHIDLKSLETQLGVPVVGTSARSNIGLDELLSQIEKVTNGDAPQEISIRYTAPVEKAIGILEPLVAQRNHSTLSNRWISLKLMDPDADFLSSAKQSLLIDPSTDEELRQGIEAAMESLSSEGFSTEKLRDNIVSCFVLKAEEICLDSVQYLKQNYNASDRRLDKILTNRWTGIPIMLLMLWCIFWITIVGANYPSQMLSDALFWLQDRLTDAAAYAGVPPIIGNILILGVYRVLAWVVSVMLPPMMIFFPLFTLLEDSGYLPRIAFNLDKFFKKANACGKQALTMCMGFGCNAAGIVGCRIIDSPREQLIAIITNNFAPCNGRFPTLIAIITMFFAGRMMEPYQSILSTALLTGVIVLGAAMTFLISRILSKTVLKGIPSSFTLELPPYRKPQIGKVIVRSLLDRTIFVLGRAVVVAAPAGLIIWILANVMIGDFSLLQHCTAFLNPFAKLLGMDGVILMAFVLGFPANEIVFPIIIMSYLATGNLIELDSLSELKNLLVQNGWTSLTAICTMLFSLMHWPCSTTCLTIKKETQSLKWTLVSVLTPTVTGIIICFLVASAGRLLGMAG